MKNIANILSFMVFFVFAWSNEASALIDRCESTENKYLNNCVASKELGKGVFYSGYWKDGKPHGWGRFVSAGFTYHGFTLKGVKHGYGVQETTSTGAYFIGLFYKGERDGAGVEYDGRSKTIKKMGSWREGVFTHSHKVNLTLFSHYFTCMRRDLSELKIIRFCSSVIPVLRSSKEFTMRYKGAQKNRQFFLKTALSNRAWALQHVGKFNDALKDLKEIKSFDNSEQTLINEASILFKIGKCQAAKRTIEIALRSNSYHRYVKQFGYMHAGLINQFCGQPSVARYYFESSYKYSKQKYAILWLFSMGHGIPDPIAKEALVGDKWVFSLYKLMKKERISSDDIELLFLRNPQVPRRQKECEANFYLALTMLGKKKYSRSLEMMSLARERCPLTYFESGPSFYLTTYLKSLISKGKNNEKNNPKEKEVKFISQGTMFHIGKGFFVTNEHVIRNCRDLFVGGKDDSLSFVAKDASKDLALLRSKRGDMLPATLRISEVKLNEAIIASGFPLQSLMEGLVVTNGVVSRAKTDRDWIFQFSASIQPGNSGGPIFDRGGNVIGVVSSTWVNLKAVKIVGTIPQNMNFGIKSKELFSFLIKNGIGSVRTISDYRSKALSSEKLGVIAERSTSVIRCR